MTLREVARVPLPPHRSPGGFDHAAVDTSTDRLFVAHTSNDAVDVVDLERRAHIRSLVGLKGVAGVWVDEPSHLLFTSNRGEDTASLFQIGTSSEEEIFRTPTGARPNGMAFDGTRGVWLIAGVGNPSRSDAPPSLTFVSVESRRTLGTLIAPGRTRWAIFHRGTDSFYVNIADPPSILAVKATDLERIAKLFPVRALGPHGLEQDPRGDRLYCACDEGKLLALDLKTGIDSEIGSLAGPPDVLWLDGERGHLYVATDDAGQVQVFGIDPLEPLESAITAPGAHTLTVDRKRHEVHVFLPEPHEDLVLSDSA